MKNWTKEQEEIVDYNIKILKERLVKSIKDDINKGATKQDILKSILEDTSDDLPDLEDMLRMNPDYINQQLDMVNSIFAIHNLE